GLPCRSRRPAGRSWVPRPRRRWWHARTGRRGSIRGPRHRARRRVRNGRDARGPRGGRPPVLVAGSFDILPRQGDENVLQIAVPALGCAQTVAQRVGALLDAQAGPGCAGTSGGVPVVVVELLECVRPVPVAEVLLVGGAGVLGQQVGGGAAVDDAAGRHEGCLVGEALGRLDVVGGHHHGDP